MKDASLWACDISHLVIEYVDCTLLPKASADSYFAFHPETNLHYNI